jgi:hypothetical protein
MKKSEQLLQDLSDLGLIEKKKLNSATAQKATSLIKLLCLSVHETAVEETTMNHNKPNFVKPVFND